MRPDQDPNLVTPATRSSARPITPRPVATSAPEPKRGMGMIVLVLLAAAIIALVAWSIRETPEPTLPSTPASETPAPTPAP